MREVFAAILDNAMVAGIMGDGWYEQNNSISMSVYDMIEKRSFQVQ